MGKDDGKNLTMRFIENDLDSASSSSLAGFGINGTGLDEIRIAILPDGSFGSRHGKDIEPLPLSILRELKAEQVRQGRYKQAQAEGQTPDTIKINADLRFNIRQNKIDDDNRFEEDPNDLPYYKQGADKKTQALFDRGYFESSDTGKLTDMLQHLLFTLVNNQVVFAEDDAEYIRVQKDYRRPDMRAVIDDDGTARGRRKVHYEPDEDEEDENEQMTFRPLALVYNDVSDSFGTEAKNKLRNDILNLLKSDYFVDEKGNRVLEVDDYYFAGRVSKYRHDTGGGTCLKNVVKHAAGLSKGRRTNLIIITDSDAEGAHRNTDPIIINGSVWLIYCDTYAPNFAKCFRLAGNDGVLEEFFFKDIK